MYTLNVDINLEIVECRKNSAVLCNLASGDVWSLNKLFNEKYIQQFFGYVSNGRRSTLNKKNGPVLCHANINNYHMSITHYFFFKHIPHYIIIYHQILASEREHRKIHIK